MHGLVQFHEIVPLKVPLLVFSSSNLCNVKVVRYCEMNFTFFEKIKSPYEEMDANFNSKAH
jgi:hypothetical protein